MANSRRQLFMSGIAAAILAIFLPLIASAQGWGARDRRDHRYDNRLLREVSRRLDDRSGDFQRHLDSALDHSRLDGTFREDRINDIVRDFHYAAGDLRRSVGDERNLNRSYDEARRVLQLGSRINQFVGRQRLGFRAENDWSQIRQDLRVIANIYNLNFYGGGRER